MASAAERSCHANPNFAVLCSFLDKYGELLGLPEISYKDLQEWIEDTRNLNPALVELHVRLLRKTGKKLSSVTWDRWEKGVVKFCRWYSDVDAWEIERFGYKLAKVSTKLTLLKNLSEYQFDLNGKFKDKINDLLGEDMRFQPIGRDKNGLAYWYLLDKDLNLRIYREHQDDVDSESWELVCRDRAGLADLISKLERGEDIKIDQGDLSDWSNKSEPVSDSNEDSCDSLSVGVNQYTPLGPSPLTIKSEPSETDDNSNLSSHEPHGKICLKLKIPKPESDSPSKRLKDKFEREKGAEIKKKKCKIKDELSNEQDKMDGNEADGKNEISKDESELSNKADLIDKIDGDTAVSKEICKDSDVERTDKADVIGDNVSEKRDTAKMQYNIDNSEMDENTVDLGTKEVNSVNEDRTGLETNIPESKDVVTEKVETELQTDISKEMGHSTDESESQQNMSKSQNGEQIESVKRISPPPDLDGTVGKSNRDEVISEENDNGIGNIEKTNDSSVEDPAVSMNSGSAKISGSKNEAIAIEKQLEDTTKCVHEPPSAVEMVTESDSSKDVAENVAINTVGDIHPKSEVSVDDDDDTDKNTANTDNDSSVASHDETNQSLKPNAAKGNVDSEAETNDSIINEGTSDNVGNEISTNSPKSVESDNLPTGEDHESSETNKNGGKLEAESVSTKKSVEVTGKPISIDTDKALSAIYNNKLTLKSEECTSTSNTIPGNQEVNGDNMIDGIDNSAYKSENTVEDMKDSQINEETDSCETKAGESDSNMAKQTECDKTNTGLKETESQPNNEQLEIAAFKKSTDTSDGNENKCDVECDKDIDNCGKKTDTDTRSESESHQICESETKTLEDQNDKLKAESSITDDSKTIDPEKNVNCETNVAETSGEMDETEITTKALPEQESCVLEPDTGDKTSKSDTDDKGRTNKCVDTVEQKSEQSKRSTKSKIGMRRKSNSEEMGSDDEIPSKRPTVEVTNDANETSTEKPKVNETAEPKCTNVENENGNTETTTDLPVSDKTTGSKHLNIDKTRSKTIDEAEVKDKEGKGDNDVTPSRKRKQDHGSKDLSDSEIDSETDPNNTETKCDGDKGSKREVKVATRRSKTPTKTETNKTVEEPDKSGKNGQKEDDDNSDDSEDSDEEKTEDESHKYKTAPSTKVRGLVAACRKAQKRQADDSPEESPVEPASKRSKVRGRVTSRGREKRRQPESDSDSTETSDSSDSDVPLAKFAGRASNRQGRGRADRSRSSPKKPSANKRPTKKKKIEIDEEVTSSRKPKSGTKKKPDKRASDDDFPNLSPSEMGLRRSARVRTLRSCRKSASPEFIPSELEKSNSDESDEDEDFKLKSKRRRKKNVESIEEVVPKGKNVLRLEAKENKDMEPVEEENETPCCKCLKTERPEWILLCDTCDAGYHTACLRPPLMIVPDGDWFCPPCEHTSLVTKLQENLKDLDQSLAKTDRLMKRKERLAFVSISLDNVIKEETEWPSKKKPLQKSPPQKEKLPFESDSGSESKTSGSSSSNSSNSSSSSSSDEESELSDPYKKKPKKSIAKSRFVQRTCRSRNPISYKFEEFDELIMDAIEEDLSVPKEPKPIKVKPPGISRGKDMSNILGVSDEDESKPKKRRKRKKRLTELSEGEEEGDDDTDDYKVSLDSDASEVEKESEDYDSEEVSDDSDQVSSRQRRKGKRGKRRKGKSWSRFSDDFVVDSDYDSEEDECARPTRRSARIRVNYRDLNSDESDVSYHSSDFSDSKSHKKSPSRRKKEKGTSKGTKRGKPKVQKKRKRVVSRDESSGEETDEYRPSEKKKGKQKLKRRSSHYESDSSWSGAESGKGRRKSKDSKSSKKKVVRKRTNSSESEGSRASETGSGSESEGSVKTAAIERKGKKHKALIKSDSDETDNDKHKSDKQSTSTEVEEGAEGDKEDKTESESSEAEDSDGWVETGESDNGIHSPGKGGKEGEPGRSPKDKTKSPKKIPKSPKKSLKSITVKDQKSEESAECKSPVKEVCSDDIDKKMLQKLGDENSETKPITESESASDLSPEKKRTKMETMTGTPSPVKKKRGRKPKSASNAESEPVTHDDTTPEITPTKKKRGPRRKSVSQVKVSENDFTTPETSPVKNSMAEETIQGADREDVTVEVTPKKKRVRKPKGQEQTLGLEGSVDETSPVKKKRGRKPKTDDQKTAPQIIAKPTLVTSVAQDKLTPEAYHYEGHKDDEPVDYSKEGESDKKGNGKLDDGTQSALNQKSDNKTDENSSSSNELKTDSPLSARRQLNAPVGVVKPEVRQGVIVENKNTVDSKIGIIPGSGTDNTVSPLQGMEKMTMGDPSQGMRGPHQGSGFGTGGMPQNYPGGNPPGEGFRHGFQAYTPQQSPGPYGPQPAHGPYPGPLHQGPQKYPQGPHDQGPGSPNSCPPSGQYGPANMPPGYYQGQFRPPMGPEGQGHPGMGGYGPHGYPTHGPQSSNYQQGPYPGYAHSQGPYQGMPMQGGYGNQPGPSQVNHPHPGPQAPFQGMSQNYPHIPQPRHPMGYNPNTSPTMGQLSPNQPLRPQSRHAVPHGMPKGPPSGPSNLDAQPRPQGMSLPVTGRRGFMMDSILKSSSKEGDGGALGAAGEGNMDEIQDIVNYVTSDKYFKEH